MAAASLARLLVARQSGVSEIDDNRYLIITNLC